MKKLMITLSCVLASSMAGAAMAAPNQATKPAQIQAGGQMAQAQKNLVAGEKFLTENKAKQGVVTLKDGLQYKIIKAGVGPKPSSTDTVTVNYEGKLINGQIFDSSFQRGRPATFPVSGVIKGWTQALQLMKQGATWELFIPAKLAYGVRGAGGVIGPNETLIFKVNLISVQNKNTQKQPSTR